MTSPFLRRSISTWIPSEASRQYTIDTQGGGAQAHHRSALQHVRTPFWRAVVAPIEVCEGSLVWLRLGTWQEALDRWEFGRGLGRAMDGASCGSSGSSERAAAPRRCHLSREPLRRVAWSDQLTQRTLGNHQKSKLRMNPWVKLYKANGIINVFFYAYIRENLITSPMITP